METKQTYFMSDQVARFRLGREYPVHPYRMKSNMSISLLREIILVAILLRSDQV